MRLTTILTIASSALLVACFPDLSSSDLDTEVAPNVTAVPVATPVPTPGGVPTATSGSESLEVAEFFDFRSTQSPLVMVSATDGIGNPIINTGLTVYRIDGELEDWSDEYLARAQLIAQGRTDASGNWQMNVEVPETVSQLMVTLNYIGIENKKLSLIDNDEAIFEF